MIGPGHSKFVEAVTSYGVRRPLIALNTQLMDENLLAQTFRGDHRRNLGVSIISPGLARRVASRLAMPPEELQQNLAQLLGDFPEQLTGRLGAIALLGRPEGTNGRRHVAYTLGIGPLDKQLASEKQTILKNLGVNPPLTVTHHMTVFSTFSHEKALKVARELRRTSPDTIEIELGRAVLFPVLRPNFESPV